MQSPSSLLKQIQRDFAAYTFVQGDNFVWSPQRRTITFCAPEALSDIWTLLHEIAHAELNHSIYNLDIDLISREAEAWEHARSVIASRYGLAIDPDHIEDHLDSYRHWLHERSKCPACAQNGFQVTKNTYRCHNCRCLWRVNEARMCALRRVRLPSQSQTF